MYHFISLKANPLKITILLYVQTNIVSCFRYKLPLTLTDSSGSLDAIAFSKVAKDLVERLAEQACMNMKIDAEEHVVTLDNSIGK
jgi:hypothetical protein